MNIILVIPQNGFQDKELNETKDVLQKAGLKCDIASKTIDKAVGKLGMMVMPDLTIEDAIDSLDMYAGVVFIGGPGATSYIDDPDALSLAKKCFDKGKVIAAICIAPMILAHAGILKNKNATVWDGDKEQSAYFEKNQIKYTGEDVTVDGNIVTGNGPSASRKFGEAIASLLEEK